LLSPFIIPFAISTKKLYIEARTLLTAMPNQAQAIAVLLTSQYHACKSMFTSHTPAFHIPMKTFITKAPRAIKAIMTTETKTTIISQIMINTSTTTAHNQYHIPPIVSNAL